MIEVPGLSPRSEALLKQFDGLDYVEKPAFLGKLVATPEGKRALEEAEVVTDAIRRRFELTICALKTWRNRSAGRRRRWIWHGWPKWRELRIGQRRRR